MSHERTSEPPPDAVASTLDSGAPGPGRRGGSRLLEIALLIVVPLALVAIFHHFAPTRPLREEKRAEPAPAFSSDDEAARLGEIRQAAQRDPEDWSAAISRLRDFIVVANDPALRERAVAWKKALEETAGDRTYRVRLKRFRLSRDAYNERFHESIEPGDPDVYVRVERTRAGHAETAYDGRGFALEGWSGEWDSVKPPNGASAEFTLSWRRDEPIRVSLMEKDMAGDNVIAHYVCESGLAILLVSSPRISAAGHIVELESDFAFGK
jgi:hypothetical protein